MRLSLKLGFLLPLLLLGSSHRAAAQTGPIDVLIMSKDYRKDPGLVRDRDSIASSFSVVLEPDDFGQALDYIGRIGRGGRIRRLVFLGHGGPNRPDWFSEWKPWTWGSERGGEMVTQEGANAETITSSILGGLASRLWRTGDSSLADAFAPQAEVIFLNCYLGRDPQFVSNAAQLLLGFSGGTVYASPDTVVSDESAGSQYLLNLLSIVMPSAEEARSHRSPNTVDYHQFKSVTLPVFPARDLREASLQATGPNLAISGEKVALRAVDRSGRLQSPQIAPYIRYTWRLAGQKKPISDGIGKDSSPPKAGYDVLLTNATSSANITVEAFLDNGIAARKLGNAELVLKVEGPREVTLQAVATSDQDFSVTASVANGPVPAGTFWDWEAKGGVLYQGRGSKIQAHCQDSGDLTARLQMYDSQASVHTLGTASVRLIPKKAPQPSKAGGTYTAAKGGADQWGHLRVTLTDVGDFKTEDRQGWRNNGTGFSARTGGQGKVEVRIDVTDKADVSYFDYTVRATVKTSGKELLRREETIPKTGGSKTYSCIWDPATDPGGLHISVETSGGNPEFFTYFVAGDIGIGEITDVAPQQTAAPQAPSAASTTTPTQASAAPPASPPAPSTPAANCASEVTLYTNSNIAGVANGPTRPTRFTLDAAAQLSVLLTYHWNNGRGQPPGSVGLQHQDGTRYGPWQAVGEPGQGGVLNVNWIARPQVVLKPGTYTVLDSHEATWAQNPQSGGQGFVTVRGCPAAR